MKRLSSWTSTAVVPALAVLLATGARAQGIRADVPFPFTAGKHVLPAGEYSFTVDTEHMLSRITPLNSTETYLLRLVPGGGERSLEKAGTSVIRFEKYGQRYTLVELWREGFTAGSAVVRSRPPKEYAKGGRSVDIAALQ